MFHVKHHYVILKTYFCFLHLCSTWNIKKHLQKSNNVIKLICAIKVIEIGQDWKIAAIRSNFYVHFFYFIGRCFMNNKLFFDVAFKEAEKAFNILEVPIGAVIVQNGKIISTGHNQKELKNCALEHAELIAIRKASQKAKNWRLTDCDIFVTMEPCEMCAAAIKSARIRNIYSALANDDENIHNNVLNILKQDKSNPQVNLINNLDIKRGKEMIEKFFYQQRH